LTRDLLAAFSIGSFAPGLNFNFVQFDDATLRPTLHSTTESSADHTAMSPKIDFDSIEEDLSDEQIQELLRNAERRLKGDAVASHKQHTIHSQQT